MTALLRLNRYWWLYAAVAVAVATTGVVIAISGHGKPAAKVLGEKVTGSGSSSTSGTAANKGNGQNNGNGNGNASPGHAFTISGAVDGLFPGATSKLFVTVTNPNNQAMTVTDLSATLQSVSDAPGCDASTADLTIGKYTGEDFDVAKNSSASSSGYIPLSLPHTVANACQGATYNLQYSGTAVQK
jgi:hypothetical protein